MKVMVVVMITMVIMIIMMMLKVLIINCNVDDNDVDRNYDDYDNEEMTEEGTHYLLLTGSIKLLHLSSGL